MIIMSLKDVEEKVTEKEIQEQLRKKAIKKIAETKFLAPLSEEFSRIEKNSVRVSDIVMNSKTFYDFRGLSMVSPETEKRCLQEGFFSMIWGAYIWLKVERILDWEVKVYGEGDPSLGVDFPDIIKSKKKLKLI
jgi:hypothetical protein